MKRNIRPYSEKAYRKFRADKRHPKRTTLEVTEDLGDKQRKFKASFPYGTRLNEHIIPKEESGQWRTVLRKGDLKVKEQIEKHKFYLYVKDDYIDELEFNDLYQIGKKFLDASCGFNESIWKRYKGRLYKRYTLTNYGKARDRFNDPFRPNFGRKQTLNGSANAIHSRVRGRTKPKK